jgi:hypothetical protein
MIKLGTVVMENGENMTRVNYFYAFDKIKDEYRVRTSELYKSEGVYGSDIGQIKDVAWDTSSAETWMKQIKSLDGIIIITEGKDND